MCHWCSCVGYTGVLGSRHIKCATKGECSCFSFHYEADAQKHREVNGLGKRRARHGGEPQAKTSFPLNTQSHWNNNKHQRASVLPLPPTGIQHFFSNACFKDFTATNKARRHRWPTAIQSRSDNTEGSRARGGRRTASSSEGSRSYCMWKAPDRVGGCCVIRLFIQRSHRKQHTNSFPSSSPFVRPLQQVAEWYVHFVRGADACRGMQRFCLTLGKQSPQNKQFGSRDDYNAEVITSAEPHETITIKSFSCLLKSIICWVC